MVYADLIQLAYLSRMNTVVYTKHSLFLKIASMILNKIVNALTLRKNCIFG